MPKTKNFIDEFKNDHFKILSLISSFKETIESSDTLRAKDILDKLNSTAEGHFSFEQVYLYPRLRRLIHEITQNLYKEQQAIKDFIAGSKELLENGKLNKQKVVSILEALPRLSNLFKDCNDLVSLTEKFSYEEKEDLRQKFKECRLEEGLVRV